MPEHDRTVMTLEMILTKGDQRSESQGVVDPGDHVLSDRRSCARPDPGLRRPIGQKIERESVPNGVEGLRHERSRLRVVHRVERAGKQGHIGAEPTERTGGCEQVGTDGMTKAVLDAMDALAR